MNHELERQVAYELLRKVTDRFIQAHLTSVTDVVALYPEAHTYLMDAHTRFCARLKERFASAAQPVDVVSNPVDENHDPFWLLWSTLDATLDFSDAGFDTDVHDAVLTRLGLPVAGRTD